MDKIDKIRQEIKRRHDYENEMYHKKKPDGRSNDGWAESLAIMGVLEELLTFLDTLSEEPDKSLEEAAEKYSDKYCSDWAYRLEYEDAFIAGAEWQYQKDRGEFAKIKAKTWCEGFDAHKEQMLKDSVEGRVFMSFAPGHNQMVMADVDLPTNTKVRIVVLKEKEE